MPAQGNRYGSPTDGADFRRVARWISRSRRAMLADLEIVEPDSLEVLLYCPDDLAGDHEAPPRAIERFADRLSWD